MSPVKKNIIFLTYSNNAIFLGIKYFDEKENRLDAKNVFLVNKRQEIKVGTLIVSKNTIYCYHLVHSKFRSLLYLEIAYFNT